MPDTTPNAPFASRQELQSFWRPLDTAETQRADILLVLASDRLRLIARQSGVDLDETVAEDQVYNQSVKFIVLEAVKRALQTPQNIPPVNNYQQTAGPYSENFTFTNPSGDLWFKKSDLKLLGLSGSQRISSIPGTEADIYN